MFFTHFLIGLLIVHNKCDGIWKNKFAMLSSRSPNKQVSTLRAALTRVKNAVKLSAQRHRPPCVHTMKDFYNINPR